MKRIILFGMLAGLLAANSGCGLCQSVLCYRPCVSRGDCDDGCGPVCGPRSGRLVADCDTDCEVGCARPCRRPLCQTCNPCDDPCADPCADPCSPERCGRVWYRGPLSCVFALFRPRTWCGRTCGERYWGDFYSDSPDCWDPCDGCGNYTGGSAGGCRNCGGNADGYDGYSRNVPGGRVDDGIATENMISQSDRVVGPAAQPHRVARP